MQHYKVLTRIRGLRRADAANPRAPIDIGEVIALPDDVARSLAGVGAIEPTDADVTCEIDFSEPEPRALIASDDVDALIAAVNNVGGAARIIAAADVAELKAALEKIEPGAVIEHQVGKVDLGEFGNAEQFDRLLAGVVEAGAISAEAANAPDVDPVGVALSALTARGDEIARLTKELEAARAEAPAAPAKRAKPAKASA